VYKNIVVLLQWLYCYFTINLKILLLTYLNVMENETLSLRILFKENGFKNNWVEPADSYLIDFIKINSIFTIEFSQYIYKIFQILMKWATKTFVKHNIINISELICKFKPSLLNFSRNRQNLIKIYVLSFPIVLP
jgi:hypothetical protein